MIVLTMVIATMEHVSAEKVTPELIVQLLLAQTIVSLEENVLTTHAFAHQDGHISIAQLNFAPMIAVETDIVRMDHVFAILSQVELIVESQVVLETVMEMDFA